MIRSIFLVLSLFLVNPVFGTETGTLHLTPLHIDLPNTWNFNNSSNPIEGKSTSGEVLQISILRQRDDGKPRDKAIEVIKMGLQHMQSIASKNGYKIIRDMRPIPVPDGKAGFSLVAQVDSTGYFNQYALSADGVMIYITYQGRGDAIEAAERFDGYLQSQRWD